MEKNELTIKEFEKIASEILRNSPESISIIKEGDFKERNISYLSLTEEVTSNEGGRLKLKELFFSCNDGIVRMVMELDPRIGEYYTYIPFLKKLNEDELIELATKLEDLKERTQTIEKILDAHKLRGLFAKMKASK